MAARRDARRSGAGGRGGCARHNRGGRSTPPRGPTDAAPTAPTAPNAATGDRTPARPNHSAGFSHRLAPPTPRAVASAPAPATSALAGPTKRLPAAACTMFRKAGISGYSTQFLRYADLFFYIMNARKTPRECLSPVSFSRLPSPVSLSLLPSPVSPSPVSPSPFSPCPNV